MRARFTERFVASGAALALLLTALIVGGASRPAQAAAPAGATIVGKVRAGGTPVANARVLPYRWDSGKGVWQRLAGGAEGTTGSDGKYRLRRLDPGRYHLLVLPPSGYAPVWYGAEVEWDHDPFLTFDPSKVAAGEIRGSEIRVQRGQKSKGHHIDLTPVGHLSRTSTTRDSHGTSPVVDLRYYPRNDANATGTPIIRTWQRPEQLSIGMLEPGTHTFWSRTSSGAGAAEEPWIATVVQIAPTTANVVELPGQAALHARTYLMDFEHVPGTPLVGTVARATVLRWTYPVKDLSVSVQWLRDGVPIPGATGDTYAITAADVGTMLQVEATATRTGYVTGLATSEAVLVRETPRTTVSLALNRSKVPYGETDKVVVDVTVTLSDGTDPQGYGLVIHQGCSEENPAQDACVGWGAYAQQLTPTTWRLQLPALLPIQDRIYAEFLAKPYYQWAETSVPLKIKPQPSTVTLKPKKKLKHGAASTAKVKIAAPHNRRTDIRGTVVVKAGSTKLGTAKLKPMGGKKGQQVAARTVKVELAPIYRSKAKLRAVFKPEKVSRTLPSNNAKVLRGDSGAKRGVSKKVVVRPR